MPMMRRGPLDRYPAEWVLRQAGAHRATGSLEFHGSHPATIYVTEGRVYGAHHGHGPEAAPPDQEAGGEPAARTLTVGVVTALLGADGSGWYYLDPLGHLDGGGPWRWEVATLVMDARSRNHEVRSLGPWTTGSVVLREPAVPPERLTADGWAVIVAVSTRLGAPELREHLGWSPDRFAEALGDLQRGGVLAAGPRHDVERTASPTSHPLPVREPLAVAGPGSTHRPDPARRGLRRRLS